MNECIYCKSTDIEKGLPIVAREYIGSGSPAFVGPYYLTETKKFLGQLQYHCKHEPMYADVCKQCGSVRFYVKNANKDWQKEFPSIKKPVIWHNG
jgi:hypothetical protein